MGWNSHSDVLAWQTGVRLAELIYLFTARFPEKEQYGLVTQMRRSAVSVPSNIAEGWARRGKKQWLVFLSYALGSLAELDTQYVIALNLKLANPDTDVEICITDCRKLIFGLIKSLRD